MPAPPISGGEATAPQPATGRSPSGPPVGVPGWPVLATEYRSPLPSRRASSDMESRGRSERLSVIMAEMVPVVDDILAAPVGVALLDRLELVERGMSCPFDALTDSDPESVDRALATAGTMPVGQLLHTALDAADRLAGPWRGGAPDNLALAYEFAPARRPLAEALWQRFCESLAGPMGSQEHWLSRREPGMTVVPGFIDFSRVYGNGEFTWSGFWTVSAPTGEIHDDLVAAWEMVPGPISRWHMPIHRGARVWNIDHPSDWVRLVETFPKMATEPHAGWELPGPNQHRSDVARLASIPEQHGVRTMLDRHVLPDWDAVASEYDGVHLSWAGFITTEGFVSDLGDRGATMLRYWSSERTLWLRDVFGNPSRSRPRCSRATCQMRSAST